MRISVLVVAASALAVMPAAAQFKCTGADGKVTFQQTPCATADKQQQMNIRSAPPTPVAGKASGESGTVEQRMVRSMERERRIREIEQEIADTEAGMNRRGALMQAEMSAIRDRKALASNNLAGATWEQSLSTEMQAVAAKYKTLSDLDLERLKQLRADLAKAKGSNP